MMGEWAAIPAVDHIAQTRGVHRLTVVAFWWRNIAMHCTQRPFCIAAVRLAVAALGASSVDHDAYVRL